MATLGTPFVRLTIDCLLQNYCDLCKGDPIAVTAPIASLQALMLCDSTGVFWGRIVKMVCYWHGFRRIVPSFSLTTDQRRFQEQTRQTKAQNHILRWVRFCQARSQPGPYDKTERCIPLADKSTNSYTRVTISTTSRRTTSQLLMTTGLPGPRIPT